MNRRHVLWGLVIGAGVLMGGWAAADVVPALAQQAKSVDMIGMLRELETANDSIGETNEAIGHSLSDMGVQSAKISRIDQRLTSLQEGLDQQKRVMDKLQALTADQARLSRKLQEQTAAILPHTQELAEHAAVQAAALEGMKSATAGLASAMGRIHAVNGSTNRKMWEAERLSALVLTRMPF